MFTDRACQTPEITTFQRIRTPGNVQCFIYIVYINAFNKYKIGIYKMTTLYSLLQSCKFDNL